MDRTTSHRHDTFTRALTAMLGMAVAALAGCETKSFFDPSEMGAYPQQSLVVPILHTIDPAVEEPDDTFAQSAPPTPADLEVNTADYTIGAADAISVSVVGLAGPGAESILPPRRVTDSGFISLPLIGQVKAVGMTEAQLEAAIAQAYKDQNYIADAQVTVSIVEARARTFSIFGAVAQPGEFPIFRGDLRLLDALVLARDVTSVSGIDTIYVIRKIDASDTPADSAAPGATPSVNPDLLAPQSLHLPADRAPKSTEAIKTPEPLPTTPAGETDWNRLLGARPGATAPKYLVQDPADGAAQEGRVIVIDGQQVPAGQDEPAPALTEGEEDLLSESTGASAAADASTTSPQAAPFEFNGLREPTDVRVIKIPYQDLKRGELKYNIAIRPRDFILVPQPTTGVFYMGGHVARVGVYQIDPQGQTLKSAVIAAGMLDQVAIPSRTQITRRIGTDREIIVRVDLDKIFSGLQPDLYLKPHDQVMVGTNAIAPFWATIRNSFRFTYGFGFLYDRNYGDDDDN